MFDFFNTRIVRVYIVPGAVFQSVMVGGGYGTGREIVEYFTAYGALGGLLGLGIAFAALALILALTFEFSRLFRVYDYRNFFKLLLGRGWVAYSCSFSRSWRRQPGTSCATDSACHTVPAC